ncbi:MAG: PAS domain S-box protein [Thermoleophilia bacterium]|nr:PAS domain S-box protein [Thermoleophilia bacterium]
MFAEIEIATVLACLVGISVFLSLVLLAHWVTQFTYPGFGPWVVGGAVTALAYIFVAFRDSLPGFFPLVATPGLMVLATQLRFESLRRFLGSTRFDCRTLVLPVIATGMAAYFAYGPGRPHLGYAVAAGLLALVSWTAAGLVVVHMRRRTTQHYPPMGLVFALFGALILAYGVYWGSQSEGSPLADQGILDIVFFGFLIYFEVLWAIMLLASHARRTSMELEAAQRIAEQGRRRLSDIIAFLPDAMFATDADRRVVAWNRAAEELTGTPAEQVVGLPYEEGVIKALGYQDEALIGVVLDPTRPVPERYRDLRRDGDWLSAESEAEFPGRPGQPVHLWVTAGLLRDPSGAVTGAIESIRDVSERVKAQKLLRESEARLLQAQAVSHVGNWEVDLVGQSLWLSPETLRIHGDDVSKSYFPLEPGVFSRPAEDPSLLRAALERAIAGEPFDLEYRIIRVDNGALRTVHNVAYIEYDEAGSPVKISGVVQDITDLRQVEEALKLTQYSVDHAGDRVFWVDSRGRFARVSDSTCEQLGYSREELLGMSIYDIDPTIVPDDWAEKWDMVREAGSSIVEGIHRTKGGKEIPVETSVHFIVHDGKEYHFVYTRDVTEQKEREEALRLTQYSVDHAGDQVFWISPEGRFLQVSDSTCQQLGYSREELLGMSIYDVDPTLSRDWRHAWEAVKHRGSNVHEALLRTKDGAEIPVEVRSDYLEHNGQEYNLVFARDISERKRVESEMMAAEGKIRQSQTMEAIGQLAGGIAHDFNNLLTAIIGYGNLILASDEIQGESVRTDVEEIRTAAERASSLTRQILAFSRRQALRPQVISLSALAAELEPQIRETLGGGIEYSVVSEADPCYVDVDRNQFEQVLMSLMSNAKDAMPDGGDLTVQIRNVELDEEYCRAYPDSRPGDYAMISVSDTGVGMTAETVAHVFEPFFTTKAPGAGTGLGLSMAYGIVRQSGGFVNVYSDVGEGTTFKVYLPHVQRPSGAAEKEPVSARSVRGDETVLVVEDEDPLRRLIARVLSNLGYQVVVAGSGPEALEMLEVLDRPPDLLLTDVILPGGLQGNELAKRARERLPRLAVLYMSGHTRDAIVHSGRLDEGVDFLGKPFTPESLAARVRDVLGHQDR